MLLVTSGAFALLEQARVAAIAKVSKTIEIAFSGFIVLLFGTVELSQPSGSAVHKSADAASAIELPRVDSDKHRRDPVDRMWRPGIASKSVKLQSSDKGNRVQSLPVF